MQQITFSKLSGSGNDFICIDNLDGRFDTLLADKAGVANFARTLCRRALAVGADGIMFATRPEVEQVADVSARYFEADGSEAELCGNGTACFVRWLVAGGMLPDRQIRILTAAGVVTGIDLPDGYVRVCIPLPEGIQTDIAFELADGTRLTCDFAITGVPHAVIYVPDVEKVDMPRLGPAVRYHKRFQPRGVNANFVQVLGEGDLAVRTWEFGVEGETLACGTGSAASAILAARRFGWGSKYTSGAAPVRVRARSGEVLRIYLEMDASGTVTDLCLESRVRCIYNATLSEELMLLAMQKNQRG